MDRLAPSFMATAGLFRAAESLDFTLGQRLRILHGRRHAGAVVGHQVDFDTPILIGFAGFRSLALLGVGGSALAGPRFRSLVGADPIDLNARWVNLSAGAGAAA